MKLGPLGNMTVPPRGGAYEPLGNMVITRQDEPNVSESLVREALSDWDERFRKWECARFEPLQSLCYKCAAVRFPELASQFRNELREASAQCSGPMGMTGTMHCNDCGGWRSLAGWIGRVTNP